MVAGPEWLSLVPLGAAVLVAAKAHGRQVRLEREASGYHDVDFGADNAPWVEDLWRRDRNVYWVAFGAVAVALAGALLLAAVPLPVRPATPPHPAVQAAGALAWALLSGFFAAGTASLLRSRRAGLLGRGFRGTAAWWAVAAGLAAGNVAAALLA